MSLEQKIAKTVKENDQAGYSLARYPEIQEGESLEFNGEDFSDIDFSNFNMGFWIFDHCKLDSTKGYSGVPIVIKNCSARGVDWRGASLVIDAENTDFSGLKIDEETEIYRSSFRDCIFDEMEVAKLLEKWSKDR